MFFLNPFHVNVPFLYSQELIQKEEVEIDGEKGAQISNLANIRMTLDHDWSPNKMYKTSFIFSFIVIMLILFYRYDQKTRITFTVALNLR